MPPQQLRAELRWSPGEYLYLAPSVEWTPWSYYIDHANSFKAPGYTIAGLRVGGRLAKQWSWFADARNLGYRKWIASLWSVEFVPPRVHWLAASWMRCRGRGLRRSYRGLREASCATCRSGASRDRDTTNNDASFRQKVSPPSTEQRIDRRPPIR